MRKENIFQNRIFLHLLFLLSVFLCGCSCDKEKNVSLPNTEIKFLTSSENGIKYKLYISLPEGYHSIESHSHRDSYPVLYLLDPDVEFSLAESIARTLVNYNTINPFIIVGIGYQEQDLAKMDTKTFWDQWDINRARDYVPIEVKTGVDDFEKGDADHAGLATHTGGSEKFKNFIEKEIIPDINRSYRTSNERGLFGHSQGGLFAAWMMLNHPLIFKNYIILSPSLWIEQGQMIQQVFKLSNSAGMKAYFAVGSLEYDSNRSMVDEVKLFYSKLPHSNSFESKLDIIEGENHVSMVPAALTKGLKFLFSEQRLDTRNP